ncbi:MAG: hypothetical protein CL840_21865 [Crocinitomicaceae bacterium]|nr:hypothetical protein [Crocinitomicaceae bacterium]|tara:strand:+ start:4928 stop:6166 length:1239 start_codon:yes stop_codon:yes gene_type:complete
MLNSIIKKLGPGLLYAGAAVGVSHLVQSTRAGAQFGYGLIWVIVIAHLVKYPFFLMGPLYAQHTGKSILSGYKQIGNWALWAFITLSAASMFAVIAAISVVTAGLAENIFHLQFDVKLWTSVLILFCTLILLIGKYSLLDRLIKWVIVLLSVTTVTAFLLSTGINHDSPGDLPVFNWSEPAHLLFLIAFIGWMPAPMDISIWHSVWQVEKQATMPEISQKSNIDFNIGFIGTAVLALLFLSLGAGVFYKSGQELAAGGIQFSAQLINLYSSLLGDWAFWIIAIAAFTTMFSTIITCLDAFPRVVSEASQLLVKKANKFTVNSYIIYLIILGIGSQVIVYLFMDNMKQMVDFATTVSFLTTPLLAILNFKAIQYARKESDLNFSNFKTAWTKISLVILLGFALYYLYFKLVYT